jgi:predicted acyltransferase (DUF342 family)
MRDGPVMKIQDKNRSRRDAGRMRGRGTRRGSAVVFLLLIMSVLVTGMVATMTLLSGIGTQAVGMNFKRNAAFYAAEAGIQQAVWNMNNNPTWLNSLPLTTTLPNGYTYTVRMTTANPSWPDTPLVFQSVGSSPNGDVVSQASVTLTSTVLAPAVALGTNLTDSGNLTVSGTVQAKGNITRGGTLTLKNVAGQTPSGLQATGSLSSGGNFSIPGDVLINGGISSGGTVSVSGNVLAGGSITYSGSWNVGGQTHPYQNPNVSVTGASVDTDSLASQARTDTQSSGTVIGGGIYGDTTIDFTQTSNHVVLITGNASFTGSFNVIGSGTLIVQGDLSISGNVGSAGSPAQVNIVTTGSTSLGGASTIQGAVASGGNLTRANAVSLTGVLVVQGSLQGSSDMTVKYASPPWFIRYTNGSGQNIQTSNFTGPAY